MSSRHRQHFTEADLRLLDRVLERARIPNSADPIERAVRLEAARFLIATFQNGITNEPALYSTLMSRPITSPTLDEIHLVPRRPEPITDAPVARGGYRFGRRVERNGTWTIYHVFCGTPAIYDSWHMSGLNLKTADRALRILNAPVETA